MIIDHPSVCRKVFYPRPSDARPSLEVEIPDARLACFHCHRHPEAGVLLHFHGNGELAADYAEGYAELFLDMGINVCFAEYRGYGASTGTPALGAMLPDGERIVRALGTPPDRIVAFGRSLGCVYAVELARRLPQLAGVVLESGVADMVEALRSLIGSVDRLPCTVEELIAEVMAHFDLKAYLQSYKGRLLVLHAAQDQMIDRSHGERLHAWGGGQDKRLVMFPKGNHNTILFANFLEYIREVEDFLVRAGVATGRKGAVSPSGGPGGGARGGNC